MIVLFLIIIFLVFILYSVFSKSGSSRYSKTRTWADFDPGKDTDKVGDPNYPTAGMDNTLKEDFLNRLSNKK